MSRPRSKKAAGRPRRNVTRPAAPTPAAPPVDRRPTRRADHRVVVGAVLAVLTVNGALSAVMGTFYLPWRVDVVPVPVAAVGSGAVNLALVWVAAKWTSSTRTAALPLWSWLATVAALSTVAPGDDVMFGGRGVMTAMPLLLLAAGVGPAAWLLWRRPPPVGTDNRPGRPPAGGD